MNLLTRSQCVVTCVALLAALSAAICALPAQAQSVEPVREWKFSITPYLWLPNINGTLKYDIPPGAGGSPEVESGPNDYLENLQALIMISGDVRKDRWSAFTDLIYLSFADQDSAVKTIDFGGTLVSSSLNIATSTTFRGMAWTLGAGYAVRTGSDVTLDIIGGFRYFALETSAEWQLSVDVVGPGGSLPFPASGTIYKRQDLLDGIVGVRGRVPLGGSNWSIPYYLDVGTGSTKLTYHWMLGIAYSFDWGGVTLAYRDLYYDQGNDGFLQNLRFSGPAVGVTFRF